MHRCGRAARSRIEVLDRLPTVGDEDGAELALDVIGITCADPAVDAAEVVLAVGIDGRPIGGAGRHSSARRRSSTTGCGHRRIARLASAASSTERALVGARRRARSTRGTRRCRQTAPSCREGTRARESYEVQLCIPCGRSRVFSNTPRVRRKYAASADPGLLGGQQLTGKTWSGHYRRDCPGRETPATR